jgi:hypothetical protein
MALTRTRAGVQGRDLHMFECTGCDFGQVMSADAADPDGEVTWVLGAAKAR